MATEEEMRVTPRFLKLLILSSISAHVLFLVAGRTFLNGWHWAHHPLHAVVEAAGTFVALSMAPMLLYLDGQGRGTSYNRPIANALIVMGILDGAHAVVYAGNAFVWLHSIATLLGGLLFALIWVPERWSRIRLGPGHSWWGWHLLRLVAYLVALWFLIEALKSEARALARKTLENEQKSRALERSNMELQQFAYIASHDLQEPLRQVASFTDLLAMRYEGQLDERAQTYIRYAVSGALRMQQLINDLLDFARIGQSEPRLAITDCNALVEQVLADLQLTIEESGARITCASLPMIMADERLLGRVFQNLIANSIKFRGQEPPRVHVSARRDGEVWELAVEDNGIGIDEHEAGRLFEMFQRLHARGDYPGTGMGLAIAKKIVQHHGGRIWFASQPGMGTTFYFTIRALEAPGA